MGQELNLGALRLRSPAFSHHEEIPPRHAKEGENVAPSLSWEGLPEGTRSVAVVCHDPDAPLVDGFTHWVAYGIDPESEGLEEGGEAAVQGVNSTGGEGYTGPAPPPGHGGHHYYFWVYALREDPGLAPGLERRELLERIEDLVIEQARLVGTYRNEG
jgi:Raf kinase inhibitor-like YbhB/YbcL family protein